MGPVIVVERWVFEGHTAFSDAELEAVLAPFTGRPLTTEDLVVARDALTLHYVEAGYVTSGAVIPDQRFTGRSLRVVLVEGRLEDVEVRGAQWYRPSVLEARIARFASVPLHAPTLEREIRLLQQDPRIQRVDAVLRPGERPGVSRLLVRVAELSPFRASLEADNHLGPSLGEARGRVVLRNENAFGFGDRFFVTAGGFEAGPEVEVGYRLPLNRWGTSLETNFRWIDFDSVDDLGDDLDVEGHYINAELGIWQPVWERPEILITVGATMTLQDSRVEFLGTEELDDVRLAVMRFDQELIWRGRERVLSARSQLNWGIDVLGATTRPSSVPDSRFFAWLGQAQWAQRFEPWGVELHLRGDLQFAADPLPAFEQLSIGGHDSVRGYRENRRLRDQGAIGSIEIRLPIWREAASGRVLAQLAPFFDVGHGWNFDKNGSKPNLPNRNRNPTTLYSLGVGLRVQPFVWFQGEVYWARPLVKTRGDGGIQGDGLHFRVRVHLL